MQKPGVLTTFGRSDYNNNIYLNIRDLTPAMYGHYIPAKGGQGHWLFQQDIRFKNICDNSAMPVPKNQLHGIYKINLTLVKSHCNFNKYKNQYYLYRKKI
jgi:hypothetical protein